MKKVFLVIASISVLMIAFSIVYYFVVFMPGKGKVKQESEEQKVKSTSSQRVPVFLSHSGETYYCDSEKVDEVKEASSIIARLQGEVDECNNFITVFAQECGDKCEQERRDSHLKCPKIITDSGVCIIVADRDTVKCLESCKTQSRARFINCPTINRSDYDSLDLLLGTYCNL